MAATLAGSTPDLLTNVTPEQISSEAYARSEMCTNLGLGQSTPADAIAEFELDTERKQYDFVVGCVQLFLGVQIGQQSTN